MKDWKKAMSTWINNIDEDIEEQEAAHAEGRPGAVKANAFTGFENQNSYDESLEEELLRISAEGAYEKDDSEQDQEQQEEKTCAGEGIPERD
jgi:hypothetical protein